MRILYGVQGTGNGHITRARTMARALAEIGAQVDWVFSGRSRDHLFDMDVFGHFSVYRGLTFVIREGRVLYLNTMLHNNLPQVIRDSRALDLGGYDLILNDFEPVTAWAARQQKREVIGISHQNAFFHDIPKRGNNPAVAWLMRNFAPVSQPIGLHWHHFGQPILPPLVEPSRYPNAPRAGHYLVYLPFADVKDLTPLLNTLDHCQFYMYHGVSRPEDHGNLHIRPFSRDGFQRDLHACEGVLCNAGFELASEAIQLGKKLLVQPVKGQMEQLSNARALSELGYGRVIERIDGRTLSEWVALPRPEPIVYPDVAPALARWLKSGATDFSALRDSLWRGVPEPSGGLGQAQLQR